MNTAQDQIKRAKLSRIRIPELEGRVNIQLFNARTGALEKEIKGKNIITDAVKDIFATNYYGATDYKTIMPIIKELLGGVLCFNQQITAQAANYYAPTNNVNQVKAHAGQTTYTTTTDDSTRGLPNGTESTEITNGFRHVFDFPATQGNGTINALCLTHKDTGDYWLFNGDKFKPFLSLNVDTPNYDRGANQPPQFYDQTNRIAYQCTTSGTTLTIWELKNWTIKEDIGLVQPIATDARSASITQIAHNITLSENANKYIYIYKEAAQQLHALYCSGATISRVIINLQDFTTSTGSLTVPGANMAPFGQLYTDPLNNCGVGAIEPDQNGYIYVREDGNAAVYKIKYSDTTDVTRITCTPGNPIYNAVSAYISTGNHAVNPWSGVIISGNTAYNCAYGHGTTNPDFNIAGNQNTIYPHTRANQIGSGQLVYFAPRNYINQPNARLSNILSKLYLGSIFNLSEPITKTSAQAMKITYEVTEQQPEQEGET